MNPQRNKLQDKLIEIQKKRFWFKPENRDVRLKSFNFDGGFCMLEIGWGLLASETCKSIPVEFDKMDEEFFDLMEKAHKTEVVTPVSIVKEDDEEETEENIEMAGVQVSPNGKTGLTILYNHLFKSLKGLENKTVNPNQAKASANVAQTILNAIKLEMDYKRMIEKVPKIEILNK